jgi:hypothetical protein
VPSETVLEVVELPDDGIIGGGEGGAADDGPDDGTIGAGERGAVDDCRGSEVGAGRDGAWEAESAGLLTGGAILGNTMLGGALLGGTLLAGGGGGDTEEGALEDTGDGLLGEGTGVLLDGGRGGGGGGGDETAALEGG